MSGPYPHFGGARARREAFPVQWRWLMARGAMAVAIAGLLSACATPWQRPQPALQTPARWHAPLPHEGSVERLQSWWADQGDPLLLELIAAAQAASPQIATAGSRIRQAQAARDAVASMLEPQVEAGAALARGQTQPGVPRNTLLQASIQAAWELDLWGGKSLQREAAQARIDGARAVWHDARVAVAAETASQYLMWRQCQRVLATLQADAASRSETARLAGLAARAGFQAPAAAALARASAAEGQARVTAQRAQCEGDGKALVALTGLPDADLQQKLAVAGAQWSALAPFSIASVPAEVLAQRPDLAAAEAEIIAASAELASTETDRLPRIGLSGSIGALEFRAGGGTTHLTTWSLGPVSVSVPWFDGGRRSAGVDGARARYDEANALYQARARAAVREVEVAMLSLRSAASRDDDARVATEGYAAFFNATQARYRTGLASLVELEDARRTALAAEIALQGLRLERQLAWISLYRAVGGGWSRESSAEAAAATATTNKTP